MKIGTLPIATKKSIDSNSDETHCLEQRSELQRASRR